MNGNRNARWLVVFVVFLPIILAGILGYFYYYRGIERKTTADREPVVDSVETLEVPLNPKGSNAKNHEVLITNEGLKDNRVEIDLLDFTFFKNRSDKNIVVDLVEFNKEKNPFDMKRPIESGKDWSRNYTEPGEYKFEIRGLDSLLIFTVNVSGTVLK